MDPRELRIGNCILADGVPVTVVAIDSTTENDIEVLTTQRRRIRAKLAHLTIDPIPLSREVLQHCCGFSRKGILTLVFNQKTVLLKMNRGHVILMTETQEPMIHFWNITALHQLQNLYFCLQGAEMTIDPAGMGSG